MSCTVGDRESVSVSWAGSFCIGGGGGGSGGGGEQRCLWSCEQPWGNTFASSDLDLCLWTYGFACVFVYVCRWKIIKKKERESDGEL